MAQATISGVVDFSAVSSGKLTAGTAALVPVENSLKGNATAVPGQWTTSNITFRASEDLGGGLKATATVVADIRSGAFAAREQHINLSGGFGSVQLGRFVPAGGAGQYGFDGARTANTVGSTYALSATSTNSNFSSGLTAGSFERQNNVLQYTSPSFNGVTVALVYANNSSDDASVAGKTQSTQTGLNIAYAAGPLRVAAGMSERKVKSEAVDGKTGVVGNAGTAPVIGVKAADEANIKGSLDYIGASYNFGAATVFATQANRKDKTSTAGAAFATNADIKLTAMGVNVPMGAITLAASTYSGKDKRAGTAATATKLSGNQISLTYALSKRTQIYAVTGKSEIKQDGALSTQATRKQSGTSVGLTHSF